MAPKVATAYLHVTDEDGRQVVLRPGQEVPVALEDQVLNEDAFILVEAEEQPADPGADPQTTPVAINGEIVQVEEVLESDEEGRPLKVRINGEVVDLTPRAPAAENPAPSEAETSDDVPADDETSTEDAPSDADAAGDETPSEPEVDPLDLLDYDELQAQAKARGIAANGTKAVLLERIKAHDAEQLATAADAADAPTE